MDLKDRVLSLIDGYYGAMDVATDNPPFFELRKFKDRLQFRWTAYGVRWHHAIYVDVQRHGNKLILTNRPPYPMYLLVAMFGFVPLYTPIIIYKDIDRLTAIMGIGEMEDIVKDAIEYINKGIKPINLRPIAESGDAFFEGLLYETDAGYIAFRDEKPLNLIDFITLHPPYPEFTDIYLIRDSLIELLDQIKKRKE